MHFLILSHPVNHHVTSQFDPFSPGVAAGHEYRWFLDPSKVVPGNSGSPWQISRTFLKDIGSVWRWEQQTFVLFQLKFEHSSTFAQISDKRKNRDDVATWADTVRNLITNKFANTLID